MNKTILILVVIFSTIITQINAQELESNSKIEQGILFGSRIDSDDDFTFKIKGFGFETGYYFFKRIGKRSFLSIDLRIAYAQSERYFDNIIKLSDLFLDLESIRTQRTGLVKYKNFSLAIPIKFRYQISEKTPLLLLIGFNPYFNLANFSNWAFDEIDYDPQNDVIISEVQNQESDLTQSFFSTDLILAGFGFRKNNLMVDLYFSGGNINIDNNFINGMDKLSINLSVHYRLKK